MLYKKAIVEQILALIIKNSICVLNVENHVAQIQKQACVNHALQKQALLVLEWSRQKIVLQEQN